MGVSDDKKAELKDMFAETDKDSTGKLGLDALGDALMKLGLATSAARIKELLGGAADADFDGFVALYEKCEAEDGGDGGADIDAMWSEFDKDGSGSVPAAELVHTLKSLTEMTDDEAKKAIAEADKDNDGYITKAEFAALMAM